MWEIFKTIKRIATIRHTPVMLAFTANPDQTKPKFFIKATQSVAFMKNLEVGLFRICRDFIVQNFL